MPKCLNQKLILYKGIAISDFVPIEIEKKNFISLFHRPLNLSAIYVVMLERTNLRSLLKRKEKKIKYSCHGPG